MRHAGLGLRYFASLLATRGIRGELYAGNDDELQSAVSRVSSSLSHEEQLSVPSPDDAPLTQQQVGRTLGGARSVRALRDSLQWTRRDSV